ncbi:hypothetical protein [Cylindrospermum sp. FACHB-282]|uniref:hypothetical protein n=1 Tax=Cylindrospermum sp. FACHB-282 TaxID=2692794 RepID=UPI001682BB18|nr:hypothetical protein [Cylindrospermum sp. FACHB-282]MBD2387082.1 hypothetical protein [Cylindrospermum sp. FACHB-282]
MTLLKNSLGNYLATLAPYIPSQLISNENINNIQKIAQVIPSAITTFFGFECQLGIQKAQADFLICLDASEAGRKILGEDDYVVKLPDFLMQHHIWNRIYEFGKHWNNDTSALYEKVNNMWLEFDVDDSHPDIPVPSCFFGPQPVYAPAHTYSDTPAYLYPHTWISQIALKLLLKQDLSSAVEHQLFQCFDLLPKNAYVFQVGVMLARKSDAVRICIRNISPEEILNYLEQLNWSGSIEQLSIILNELSSLVTRIDLDLDIGEVISPKIGLECYFEKQPKQEPKWQLFLDYLVDVGLCISEKRDALLEYPGYIRENSNQDLFPSNLLKISRIMGPQYEWIFLKGLHHIKVVFQSSESLQAKAYLFASNHLVTRSYKNLSALKQNLISKT